MSYMQIDVVMPSRDQANIRFGQIAAAVEGTAVKVYPGVRLLKVGDLIINVKVKERT